MHRCLTASSPEEACQGVFEHAKAFEVVVVGDFAAEPLPDRLDRIQIGAVRRQEAEPQAGLAADECEETGAAMPGCPIEDHDDQHRRIGPQQLAQEPLDVGRREPWSEPPMDASRQDIQRPEAVDFLVRTRPVTCHGLLAGEAPLPAEGWRQLDGHLVLEEYGQAVWMAVGKTQEPSDLPFFSRRRQGGTVGSWCRGRRRWAPR